MNESEFLAMLKRRKTGASAGKAEGDAQPVEISLDASTTFIPGRSAPLTEAEKAAGVTIPNYWRNRSNKYARL